MPRARRLQGRGRVALPLMVILIGVGVYHNSLLGQFVFDDYSCIVDNPKIRRPWPLWETVSAPPETAIAGRPVVAVSLAANYAAGRLEVWGYHAFNIMLHIVSGLLLLSILRRTLRGRRLRGRYGREAAWLALTATLVWMVHPLLTESVDYIIQRTELLMGFFLLLTLYSVIRGADAAHPQRWHAAAVASCALGMASKEVMVVAPLLTLLYDRIFLSMSFRETFQRRGGLYVGLTLTWLVLAVSVATGARVTTAGFGVQGLTPWDYVKTQCGVILQYLRLAFWPHPLVADYADWPVAKTLLDVAPQALAIIVLVIATLWALRYRPAAGFLGAWFFGLLAPTSSVLPILTEVAAERRMYLPLAAVVTLIVVGGWDGLRRLPVGDRWRRSLAAGLVTILVGTLGWVTIRRNEVYRSEVSLLRDVIAKRPTNARAHYNLGIALAEQGKAEEAGTHFVEALRLDPNYAEAHGNLGAVLAKQGKAEEAVDHYRRALRLNPSLAEAHHNLGIALAEQGRYEEAVEQFAQALALNPNIAQVGRNLEGMLRKRASRPAAFAADRSHPTKPE
ncbi:MAG: tetratricopeptide repeat protein [Candidatus Omnitrophica bacterium]|nr:tetratricopeptide repeat protein [Candidatus Omnitrophota bacterium]